MCFVPSEESNTNMVNTKEKTANDRIAIRRYKPSDVDAIKKLFVEGMESNFIPGFQTVLSNPFILASMASLSLVSSFLWSQWFWGSERGASGLALPASPLSSRVYMTIMAGVATPLISCGSFLYFALYKELNGYIRYSLRTDLSNIETVYGGEGCFLVAVDAGQPPSEAGDGKNDVIVGMVGGEHKPSRQHGKTSDDSNTPEERRFELRRMSVSRSARKVGLGKRLVRQLEDELKPQSMFLTCTSTQRPAHALYRSLGFVLQPIPAETKAHVGLIFGDSIKFLRFEKMYKQ